jgi:hypothetical protein
MTTWCKSLQNPVLTGQTLADEWGKRVSEVTRYQNMDMASPSPLHEREPALDGLSVMIAAYNAWGEIAQTVPAGPAQHPTEARDALVRGIAMSKAGDLTALAAKLRVWTTEHGAAWEGADSLPAGDLLVASCLVDAARLLDDDRLPAALPERVRAYFADFETLGGF